MRKWMIPVVMLLSMVSLEASRNGCRTIEQGPPGPSGPTGATGPSGVIGTQHLYADVSGGSTTPGSPIVFSSASVVSGTAINWNGSNTFNITQNGDYLINFVAYATNTVQDQSFISNGYQIHANSLPVGKNTPVQINNNPSSLPLTLIIHVTTAPVTVQVVQSSLDPHNIGISNAMIDFLQL